MTDGIIQKVFQHRINVHNQIDSVMRGFDIWTTEDILEIQRDILLEIKKNSHWMYPEYSNGRKVQISLTAFELIGDMI